MQATRQAVAESPEAEVVNERIRRERKGRKEQTRLSRRRRVAEVVWGVVGVGGKLNNHSTRFVGVLE